ncbi:MAG: hypothetical protein B7Z15_11695 [Rhizobiales bacterium 32-66-8]|nr:MAG: hypothetical protein B7Z15_11695 [Rhizobiales bacterium 32-66-8]
MTGASSMPDSPPPPDELGPIVSSGHLAAGAMPALSEFEFAMNMTVHAFQRWMVRCMAAAGMPDLSPLDVLVLGRKGKEKTVTVTLAGEEACRRYAQIREQLLVKSVLSTGVDPKRLSEIAAAMRSLSGQYDQAARAAASL